MLALLGDRYATRGEIGATTGNDELARMNSIINADKAVYAHNFNANRGSTEV